MVVSMPMNRAILMASLVCVGGALAADPKTDPKLKGSKKEAAPKLDLGIPDFGKLPTDTKLEESKAKPETAPTTKSSPVEEGYSVVRVMHGKAFVRSGDGAKPSAPFPQVTIDHNTAEKFSTVVRVKNPAKKNARIEVVVLDYRGDTVMEASGELYFRGGAETEWTVDWEPTGVRGPGDFQVLVRVAGNPLGTFPIKFAEATK
jgi:hypothetical protein